MQIARTLAAAQEVVQSSNSASTSSVVTSISPVAQVILATPANTAASATSARATAGTPKRRPSLLPEPDEKKSKNRAFAVADSITKYADTQYKIHELKLQDRGSKGIESNEEKSQNKLIEFMQSCAFTPLLKELS